MPLSTIASRSVLGSEIRSSTTVFTRISAKSIPFQYRWTDNQSRCINRLACRSQLRSHSRNDLIQSRSAFFSSQPLSSSGPSFFSSPLGWWRQRQENQELDKYKTRLEVMAAKESWVIGDAVSEIEESVNSWRAKLPGASSTNEIIMAKKMLKNLTGIVKVVGKDATQDTLLKMNHKEKLIAAVSGETTVEEINGLIEQFGAMTIMYRALRKRKLDGKSIPSTPEAVAAVVKAEAPKLMSKEQKSKIGKEQAKRMLKRRR